MRGSIECGETVRGHTVDECGENHTGNLGPDHYYNFTIPEGVPAVTFDGCASDEEFDTHIRVLFPNMTEVAGCDDCGNCGHRSKLETEG